MLLVIYFIYIIARKQNNFVKKFDLASIEMKDFGMRIDELPDSFKKYETPIEMKGAITKKIVEMIRDAKKDSLIKNDIDESIVEIQFGLTSYDLLN
jgi:hypothetical protein